MWWVVRGGCGRAAGDIYPLNVPEMVLRAPSPHLTLVLYVSGFPVVLAPLYSQARHLPLPPNATLPLFRISPWCLASFLSTRLRLSRACARSHTCTCIHPLTHPPQIFCMVIFSIAVSLFGTLISQLNEIVASTVNLVWVGGGDGGESAVSPVLYCPPVARTLTGFGERAREMGRRVVSRLSQTP
jgi:hypothetical protein